MNSQLLPLILSTLPQTVFVVVYGLPVRGADPWWRDRIGRALFIKAAALAVVLDMLLLWVVHPGDWVRVPMTIGYWLVFVGVVYQCTALLLSRFGRHRHRA